jgi:hypothetical protein
MHNLPDTGYFTLITPRQFKNFRQQKVLLFYEGYALRPVRRKIFTGRYIFQSF